MIIHLDFEAAGVLDLRDVGTDVWTKDRGTVPILVGFAIDNQPARSFPFQIPHAYTALTAAQDIDALRRAVENPNAEIHAWNTPFEWAMWNNNFIKRSPTFPPLPIERFHCTMATAACVGLPLDLDDAAKAVGSSYIKDKDGHALMMRMARPRSVTPLRWWHLDSSERLEKLRLYNIADVEAERGVSLLIPRMLEREREIWLVDQKMNQRGMPVDDEFVQILEDLTLQELARMGGNLSRLTCGQITSSTQNSRILHWLQARGYPLDSLAKDVVTEFIRTPEYYNVDQTARHVLDIRIEAAKTSTAKLKAISAHSQLDGRVRNLVQYAGALRTLRWAGRGVQIQNFPRPSIKNVSRAIDEILVHGMDAEGLRHIFGTPLDVVASCLRGVFKAPPGYKLVVCDFHSIEAIVLAWLADFQELLDVFRRKEDVYVFTAKGIGSDDRQLGKVLRLACGFGMGPAKFEATAAKSKIYLTFDQASAAVAKFRTSNAPIVTLWARYNTAAKQAIMHPGSRYAVGPVAFRMADPNKKAKGSLLIEKPAGGYLVYRDAHIDNGDVAYWGVDQYTRQWSQIRTYGGKLVENATQAVARDLLADVMVILESKIPGVLLTTIHDEIVAMPAEDQAGPLLSIVKQWMSTPPDWAPGMPLSASGYVSDRYTKA